MSLDFIATFFAASTMLMPIFAEEVLTMGPDGLGLLPSAPAVGAVIGSFVMSLAPLPQRPGRGVIVAILVYGICILGLGLSSVLWLSLVFLDGSGAADAISMAMRTPSATSSRLTSFAVESPRRIRPLREAVLSSARSNRASWRASSGFSQPSRLADLQPSLAVWR